SSNTEEPSIVDRAIEKMKELVGKETVHPEEGFYLSAGANSNETAVLSHLAYVNQGNWGGYLRYRGNWTTGAQMAQLFIADEFTYDRNHFDQRNRGMSGTEMLRVATGDALPGWLPLTPLGTQHVAGNIEFSLDEETLLLDAAAHYSPVPGLFLELGAGYRMERQPTTHHPRIIAGILAPIYDENKVMLMVRGIVDPQTGDTNAQLDVRMNF
ncbi:MAG TPA: hypothetical protein VJI15_02985, partial [Candidatus Nanoarchaeia archaeon]|nr:hypothetical protein [Candidatus Nanoarchaeia archaeon]